jgi:hypothetical protein
MRVLLVSSLVTLTAVLGGWLVFTFISGPLVTSMYRGESLPGLNRLIRDHTHTPLESYLASSRVQFSRLVMLAVCMQAIVVAGLLWEETFFFKQSAALRTEVGTALVEADGSAWEWRQYPGALTPPQRRGAAGAISPRDVEKKPRQLPLGLARR